MIARARLLAAAVLLTACGQQQPEDVRAQEGSYGASSGPNLNDPQANQADRTPMQDNPEAATGSEFGGHMPSSPGPNEPDQATATP
jgi:hypothetical protein